MTKLRLPLWLICDTLAWTRLCLAHVTAFVLMRGRAIVVVVVVVVVVVS